MELLPSLHVNAMMSKKMQHAYGVKYQSGFYCFNVYPHLHCDVIFLSLSPRYLPTSAQNSSPSKHPSRQTGVFTR